MKSVSSCGSHTIAASKGVWSRFDPSEGIDPSSASFIPDVQAHNIGSKREGEVRISGAKNSALPAMAASLLTTEEVFLENIPFVNDAFTTRRLLRELGVSVEFTDNHAARLQAQKILSHEAPYDLVKTMRASVLVLGPLLARTGRARVSMPGGQVWLYDQGVVEKTDGDKCTSARRRTASRARIPLLAG